MCNVRSLLTSMDSWQKVDDVHFLNALRDETWAVYRRYPVLFFYVSYRLELKHWLIIPLVYWKKINLQLFQ